MYTLLLGILVASISGYIGYIIYPNVILPTIFFLTALIIFNFFMGRRFMGKLTDIMNSCERDVKAGNINNAIEKMKQGYVYSKWQFMVRQQIDSQIGVLLYANKRFDEALPYLQSSLKNNWMAMSMLGAYYFRNKDYDKMKEVMEKSSKANKKDPFTQCLYAYFLAEIGEVDKGIEVLVRAEKKLPNNDKIESALDCLKNNKKIKMKNFGALWMQLHLVKTPDGIKQYQTLIGRQKIKRR